MRIQILKKTKNNSKVPKFTYNEFENTLERNPRKRLQFLQYPQNQIDEVRRAYLKWRPYQMHLENYPKIHCLVKMIIQEYFSTHGLTYFLHG